MNSENLPPNEKPLRGGAKIVVFLYAGASIASFYLFSILTLALLLVLLGCESIIALVLARFGLVGLAGRLIGPHLAVFSTFVRSFWIQKGTDYNVSLQRGDAPRLFQLISDLALRAGVAPPAEVVVGMNMAAWVQLHGFRAGAGRTSLGLGYDLLAGLSEDELEAVLAHEMTHAKLVQRGYKKWLNRGSIRIQRMAGGLWNLKESQQQQKQESGLSGVLFDISDRLARWSARRVAACSRQDEFDADRGAVELCGATMMRSVLLKLESIEQVTSRLPWHERVAQLQTGRGMTHWILTELAQAGSRAASGVSAVQGLFNQYSTHPSLADRLAALPSLSSSELKSSPPAIGLLENADEIAERLVAEIQRVAAREEQRDSRRLRRHSRKLGRHANLKPLQLFAVALILGCFLVGLPSLFTGGPAILSLVILVAGGGFGILLFRLGRYREHLVLLIPDYALLKKAWNRNPDLREELRKEIGASLQKLAGSRTGSEQAMFLCRESYEALSRCDYLRAHEAARLCLQVNPKCIEGVLGYAVAAAALRQQQQVQWALPILNKATAMHGFSVSWGVGWSLLLCGDWFHAEAFLEKSLQYKPGDRTLLLLLAIAQSKRGKLQSAILYARQACAPRALNIEHAKLLIELQLQAGYSRDAREELNKVQASIPGDRELMLLMVRLNLQAREISNANEWLQRMKTGPLPGGMLLELGTVYEHAREYQAASELYQEALKAGFYPEALLGLGRVEHERRNHEVARQHILGALNLTPPLGENATGPLPLFNTIIGHLIALEDPAPNCRAWIASFDGSMKPQALANTSLLIYATGREQAERSLDAILNALQPGVPVSRYGIFWKDAPKVRQPDVPVRPGVQSVV